MGFAAKVLKDSVSPAGVRLTTLEVTFPRIVLAEFNTHRMLCLAGDAELEFDLPDGQRDERRVYRMRIDDFVDKWLRGARRYAANPKRSVDLSWVEVGRMYEATEVAARLGMSSASNIHTLCRSGALRSEKSDRTWLIRGDAIINWRKSAPEHTRFDMRAKLAGMRIRQLNEDTGDIQWSHVVNACESGEKEVFEVFAGDYSVAGSVDHRVRTNVGWKSIGELKPGDMVIVRKFGKRDDDKLDPLRLRKIDGVWRSAWQLKVRSEMVADDPICRRCHARHGVDIHHIVPVHQEPARALDRSNVTLLCKPCHDEMHSTQSWQGGTYLYGAAVAVDAVVRRGVEATFDLEIAGTYPNFIANGVVVHNSRNSASSRAIPVEKRIAAVEADPFVPAAFGKNQRGMKAEYDLAAQSQEQARVRWLSACKVAVAHARGLADLEVHKQLANRLLEPFLWHTVVVSATEWSNFFALRCNPEAQPEIRTVAELMRDAMAASAPRPIGYREWHLPYVDVGELLGFEWKDAASVSCARCARVSYLTQDGRRDPAEDLSLAARLSEAGHMSPFEHAATPLLKDDERAFVGNFNGWFQLRKYMVGEDDFARVLARRSEAAS